MTLRTQVLIWVGFTVVVILVIWLFRPILLPFVIGIALAYILNPVVNFVQRRGINRAWSTTIVLLSVFGAIVGLFVVVTPLIIQQIAGLATRLPGYVTALQALVQSIAPQLNEWLGPVRAAQLETSLTQFLGSGVEFLGNVTGQVAQSGLTVLNTIAVLILTPVVAFYLLLDWEGMVKGIDDLLPREHRREVRQVLDQIDHSIAGVIRGQGGVILVLCLYYSMALTLTGLNFGLVIGLMTGLLSFVPFFGFLIGFVLSIGIALVQFLPNWWMPAIVVVVYVLGQFLEGNVLYPRFVGQSININPVWLMFALFAFAFLFGFVGLLLAVPLAAITATLTRYAIGRYKDSPLYRGERPAKAPAEPELALAAPPPPTKRSPTPEGAGEKMTGPDIGAQLPFDYGHDPSHLETDFIEGEGNRLALAHVRAFPNWAHPLTLIEGPAKSGKSHLSRIWAERAGAAFADPADLERHAQEDETTPLVVEDVERSGYPEAALFHLLNQAMRDGRPVLMTAREPIANWPFATDDLKSRAQLAQRFALALSDDIQLSQMFVKLFGDRQVAVDPKVIAYLVQRMERSPEEVVVLTDLADRMAMAQGTAITRRIAAAALAERGVAQIELDLEGGDDE